jgi:hypothetical protein
MLQSWFGTVKKRGKERRKKGDRPIYRVGWGIVGALLTDDFSHRKAFGPSAISKVTSAPLLRTLDPVVGIELFFQKYRKCLALLSIFPLPSERRLHSLEIFSERGKSVNAIVKIFELFFPGDELID